jgi:hypothetical protein
VEVDGNLLPPNIVNKLNIFMVNVLRFKGNGDLSSLVDKAGSRNHRFDAGGDDGNDGTSADTGGSRGAGRIAPVQAVPLMAPPPEDAAGEPVGVGSGGAADPCAGCTGCDR